MLKKIMMGTVALVGLAAGTAATFAQEMPKEIRVGLLGGENESDRLRNNACLADHLKTDFGADKVSLFPAADYDGVIQGLLGGTLDVAEIGAAGYAAIYLKDPTVVTPVLTTQAPDGSTGYYAIGLALKTSGLKSIMDAKGKVLGYADPDSTSGYLIPLTQIPKTTGVPNDQFFARTQFNGGHENNILAMYDGVVDVSSGLGDIRDGFTSGDLRKLVDKGAVDPFQIVEVWRSPLIPNGPIIYRTALGEAFGKKLVESYNNIAATDMKCMSAIQGGDFKGYSPVQPDFYQAIIDVRKAAIGQ